MQAGDIMSRVLLGALVFMVSATAGAWGQLGRVVDTAEQESRTGAETQATIERLDDQATDIDLEARDVDVRVAVLSRLVEEHQALIGWQQRLLAAIETERGHIADIHDGQDALLVELADTIEARLPPALVTRQHPLYGSIGELGVIRSLIGNDDVPRTELYARLYNLLFAEAMRGQSIRRIDPERGVEIAYGGHARIGHLAVSPMSDARLEIRVSSADTTTRSAFQHAPEALARLSFRNQALLSFLSDSDTTLAHLNAAEDLLRAQARRYARPTFSEVEAEAEVEIPPLASHPGRNWHNPTPRFDEHVPPMLTEDWSGGLTTVTGGQPLGRIPEFEPQASRTTAFTASTMVFEDVTIDTVQAHVSDNTRSASAENQERRSRFEQARNTQAARLHEAEARWAELDAQLEQQMTQFEENQALIAERHAAITAELDAIEALVGTRVAAEEALAVLLADSFVSAQQPAALETLNAHRSVVSMPRRSDFTRGIDLLLSLIEAQHEILLFRAWVEIDGELVEMEVMRMGDVQAFARHGEDFYALRLSPERGLHGRDLVVAHEPMEGPERDALASIWQPGRNAEANVPVTNLPRRYRLFAIPARSADMRLRNWLHEGEMLDDAYYDRIDERQARR